MKSLWATIKCVNDAGIQNRTDPRAREGGQRRKCVVTNDVYQVDKWVREKRRFTISELSDSFPAISGGQRDCGRMDRRQQFTMRT